MHPFRSQIAVMLKVWIRICLRALSPTQCANTVQASMTAKGRACIGRTVAIWPAISGDATQSAIGIAPLHCKRPQDDTVKLCASARHCSQLLLAFGVFYIYTISEHWSVLRSVIFSCASSASRLQIGGRSSSLTSAFAVLATRLKFGNSATQPVHTFAAVGLSALLALLWKFLTIVLSGAHRDSKADHSEI